jgi:hypothetical protein
MALFPKGEGLNDQQPLPTQMTMLVGSQLFRLAWRFVAEISVKPYPYAFKEQCII